MAAIRSTAPDVANWLLEYYKSLSERATHLLFPRLWTRLTPQDIGEWSTVRRVAYYFSSASPRRWHWDKWKWLASRGELAIDFATFMSQFVVLMAWVLSLTIYTALYEAVIDAAYAEPSRPTPPNPPMSPLGTAAGLGIILVSLFMLCVVYARWVTFLAHNRSRFWRIAAPCIFILGTLLLHSLIIRDTWAVNHGLPLKTALFALPSLSSLVLLFVPLMTLLVLATYDMAIVAAGAWVTANAWLRSFFEPFHWEEVRRIATEPVSTPDGSSIAMVSLSLDQILALRDLAAETREGATKRLAILAALGPIASSITAVLAFILVQRWGEEFFTRTAAALVELVPFPAIAPSEAASPALMILIVFWILIAAGVLLPGLFGAPAMLPVGPTQSAIIQACNIAAYVRSQTVTDHNSDRSYRRHASPLSRILRRILFSLLGPL